MLTYASTAPAKWSSLGVTFHAGHLEAPREQIPRFERRGFGLTQPGSDRSTLSRPLNIIVRLPYGEHAHHVPIAVSRDYVLVQHDDVAASVLRALNGAGMTGDGVEAELCLTEDGERMALSVRLPKAYDIDPGDGHPISPRFECLNSVDGSTGFRALMGWFRLVCCNGLVVGTTQHGLNARHTGAFCVDDVAAVFQAGLGAAESEKEDLARWLGVRLAPEGLARWVEGALKETWGTTAAARAWHIIQSGCDRPADQQLQLAVGYRIRGPRRGDRGGHREKARQQPNHRHATTVSGKGRWRHGGGRRPYTEPSLGDLLGARAGPRPLPRRVPRRREARGVPGSSGKPRQLSAGGGHGHLPGGRGHDPIRPGSAPHQ